MALQRSLVLLAPAVVLGLQMHDAGHDASELERHTYVTGDAVVSLNDPEADLPADGVKYHIRTVGESPLIGLPKDWNDDDSKAPLQKLEDAAFVATGDFEKIGPTNDDCDDLFLRSVTIQGTRLEKTIQPFGGNATTAGTVVLKRIKFFIDDGERAFDDSIFNLNSSLGFEYELLDKATNDRTVVTLTGRTLENLTAMNMYIPFCNVHRPLGEIKLPTKKKFRHATHFMSATCTLTNLEDGNKVWHEFGVLFQTSWGGVVTAAEGAQIYRKNTGPLPTPGACAESLPAPVCPESLLDLNVTYPNLTESFLGHDTPLIDWYTNNLWFWASNVTADPDGLLGPHTNDNRAAAAQPPPTGCYKPNVNGGKQYLTTPVRTRRGPKHPRHWK